MGKKVMVEELLAGSLDYVEGAAKVLKMVEEGEIKPIKNSKMNGKRPALYNRYRFLDQKIDVSAIREDILQTIPIGMSADFYVSHPAHFEKDKPVIQALAAALEKGIDPQEISLNERSFEIFQDEKLLQSTGLRVLRNLGKSLEDLYCQETVEPVAYFSRTSKVPQTVLICENLDTYRSLQTLLEENHPVLGVNIDSIIYGAGHRIERCVRDLDHGAQNYLLNPANTLYYWGDLDYEGVRIFSGLQSRLSPVSLRPFVPAYRLMILKGSLLQNLPSCRKEQTPVELEEFISLFEYNTGQVMAQMLEAGKYLPQEIVTRADLGEGVM